MTATRIWTILPHSLWWSMITLVLFVALAVAGGNYVPDRLYWIGGNLCFLAVIGWIYVVRASPPGELPGESVRSRIVFEFRAYFVFLVYFWLYRQSEFLSLAVNHQWQNELAMKWDRLLFGELPTFFLMRHTTVWLSEWMAASYFLYIPALVVVPLVFSLRNNFRERDRVVLRLAMVFSLSFIGFILFPLQAPRFSLSQYLNMDLQGLFWVPIVNLQIQHGIVDNGGCFPSAHVAAATVLLASLWKLGRWVFIAGVIIIAPIYLATVYLHLHYAIDVLGGWVVSAVVIWATRTVNSPAKRDPASINL